MRQYASYPGGTERQRYLRTLLCETMEEFGFSGIEMEWWHFEYDATNAFAHQNIPLNNL
jgi:D-alanyl-D-alanine dipeptidase